MDCEITMKEVPTNEQTFKKKNVVTGKFEPMKTFIENPLEAIERLPHFMMMVGNEA